MTTELHHDACGFDTAAYALGALEPAEAKLMARHLSDCTVCRDELAAFEQVAAILPLSVPALQPPRRLRRRVLAEVKADKQARYARTPARTWSVSFPRPAVGIACAATIALATVLGTGALNGGAGSRAYAAQVLGSAGTAQLDVRDGQAQLVVDNLPPAAAGHVYEVWLQRSATGPKEPTTALFSSGTGSVRVPGDMARVRRVLVTQEPAGGTAVPTTAPVIVATLT